MESQRTGPAALAGNEGRNDGTHKDNVNLIYRIVGCIHIALVIAGELFFLLLGFIAVPVNDSADNLVIEDVRSSGCHFINVEFQNVAGFSNDIFNFSIFELETYALWLIRKVLQLAHMLQIIEDRNGFSQLILRNGIGSFFIAGIILNGVLNNGAIAIPLVAEFTGDFPDIPNVGLKFVSEFPRGIVASLVGKKTTMQNDIFPDGHIDIVLTSGDIAVGANGDFSGCEGINTQALQFFLCADVTKGNENHFVATSKLIISVWVFVRNLLQSCDTFV